MLVSGIFKADRKQAPGTKVGYVVFPRFVFGAENENQVINTKQIGETMLKRRTIMLLVAFAATGSAAFGAGFNSGDIFVAGGGGTLRQYTDAGVLIQNLTTGSGGFMTGMAFDASGNLYATRFSDGSINKYSVADGSLVGGTAFVTTGPNSPESIFFDAAGNFYVGQADGTRDILKFDSAGTLLANYNVATTARGSDWIDLAADQKTMFYTSENNEVKRFDVSTGTQLADFANLGARPAFALRLLSDGGLLVANGADIKRLDSSGNIIGTYDVAGAQTWFALNLDPNGTSFWTASAGGSTVYEFDIATGSLLGSFNTGQQIYGLAVAGEITQGGGGGGGNNVPDAGSSLALLGLAFASLAGIRRQLRS